jgi:RNase P/RNase MRP subunit p30
MIDIVFPEKNEAKFVSMAEKLGYSSLCFVYDYKKNLKRIKEIISLEQKKTKVKLYFGLLADKKSILKAKRISDFVLVRSVGDDQDIFEKLKPDMVYDLELAASKDAMHFRASGLNQVLCKFAAKNKIIVGFSFSSILNAKNRVMILGRITQNIRFCRKYKVDTCFASFARTSYEMRAWHDLAGFLIILGMHAGKAKSSLKSVLDRIKSNLKKKSPEYIREGIEIISK